MRTSTSVILKHNLPATINMHTFGSIKLLDEQNYWEFPYTHKKLLYFGFTFP